jgi:uncharacterized protein (TIGR03435 family)
MDGRWKLGCRFSGSLLKERWTAAAVICLASVCAIAQNNPPSRGLPPTTQDAVVRPDLAFDVVSIRPSNAGLNQWGLNIPAGGDEYSAVGMPLSMTLMLAYLPFRFQKKDRIVGAPNWLWNDRFDFIGKVAEADLPEWHSLGPRGFRVPNPMLQTMLRNALGERCKLAVHLVPAETDGFQLIVAPHGVNAKNLVEAKPSDAIPDNAQKIAYNGRMVPILSRDDPVLHFYSTSMSALAEMLSGSVGGPVADKTGLTGKYNFQVIREDGGEGLPFYWDLAPLGLKLIPAKIPTQNIVIDHIERPIPN